MKKWTIRELALILLPVVALGAYALWSRGKDARPSGRYEFTLESIKVEPATPRDVYEGFDTLVKVKYLFPFPPKSNSTHINNYSAWLSDTHLSFKRGQAVQRVNLPPNAKIATQITNGTEAEFRLRLSRVPMKYGELTFQTSVSGNYSYGVVKTGGTVKNTRVSIPPLPISVVVRKAGERIEMPQVSKHRPYVVKFIAPDPNFLNPNESSVRVIIEMMDDAAQDAEKNSWQFMRPHLIDSHGREYVNYQNIGKKVFFIQMVNPAAKDEDPNTDERVFTFSMNLIPKDAGALTFKSEVSLNDGWPLPISHVVRP